MPNSARARKPVAHMRWFHIGDLLRIGLHKGLITLPQDPTVPIICVGPGTGVAPMRAVIEERIYHGLTRTSNLSSWPTCNLETHTLDNTLYFGCRHASKDKHYGSEFQDYVSKGDLNYRVACSRDNPEGVRRTYVQDLIEEDGEHVWKILKDRQGWLYISGSVFFLIIRW